MSYPKKPFSRPVMMLASTALGGILAGCVSPVALDQAFLSYGDTYAQVVNEQMLLNLARRANNHPFYFLQLGSINSQFTFGAGLNSSGAVTQNTLTAASTIASKVANLYTGTLALNATETPVFAITPLSGTTFGSAVYKSIDIRLFYEQLAHGVPIDMLLRLMVHSVWLQFPSGKMLVLTNVPDVDSPLPFRNYLRFAALFRELQKDGAVVADTNPQGESSLVFTSKSAATLDRLRQDSRYNFWEGLKDFSDETGFPKITFITRTFAGVLTAMGQEQTLFEKWEQRYSPDQTVNSVPEGEYRPIIKLVWSNKDNTTDALVKTSYFGSDYMITDPDDGTTWNRDAFALLTSLFDMVALDPKSLPLQQLIQVR